MLAAGNRATEIDSGNPVTYSYDEANQLLWVHRSAPSLTRVTYSYDANGNLAVLNNMENRTTYSWDLENLVTQAHPAGGTINTMVYDGDGKRRVYEDSVMVRTFVWDGANQLTVEENPSARITYSYDANGNTEVMNAAGNLTTYSWDIENRMTLVQLPAGTRTTATYDGDGRRRSYEDSVMLRKFVWDGENILFQTNNNDTLDRDYTYNPQLYGELVSQSGLFHHYDALGSSMQLTDDTQGAVVSYLYRAFGEQAVLSGSSANRFGWIGKLGYYRQPDTGDYWLRARIYDPQRGRFVSRDPAGSDANRYLYVRNRPLVASDPSGLHEEKVGATHETDLCGTVRVTRRIKGNKDLLKAMHKARCFLMHIGSWSLCPGGPPPGLMYAVEFSDSSCSGLTYPFDTFGNHVHVYIAERDLDPSSLVQYLDLGITLFHEGWHWRGVRGTAFGINSDKAEELVTRNVDDVARELYQAAYRRKVDTCCYGPGKNKPRGEGRGKKKGKPCTKVSNFAQLSACQCGIDF